MCMDARMPRAHECAGASHMLILDGVYVDSSELSARFRWVKAPTNSELDGGFNWWTQHFIFAQKDGV
jgi:hypothetical protein